MQLPLRLLLRCPGVGIRKAMQQVKWDKEAFVERGVIYDWGKDGSPIGLGRRSSIDDSACLLTGRVPSGTFFTEYEAGVGFAIQI